jgi:hypothetical protein
MSVFCNLLFRFLEDKYKIDITPSHITNINRAIARGAETNVFALPKGERQTLSLMKCVGKPLTKWPFNRAIGQSKACTKKAHA